MENKTCFKYIKTKHSWHLVDPSPWPLVASLGAFFMTSGTVLYMNKFLGGGQLALIGFSIILYVMYTWWRDIVREATFEDQHTASVQRGLRLGMVLFIVSEIMFFFAFFWAFFHSSLSPVFNLGGIWPPEAIQTIQTSGIPLTNTFFFIKLWSYRYLSPSRNNSSFEKASNHRSIVYNIACNSFYFITRYGVCGSSL